MLIACGPTRLLILRLAVVINSDRQDRKLVDKVTAKQDQLSLKLTKAARLDAVLQAQLDDETTTFKKLGYRLLYTPS